MKEQGPWRDIFSSSNYTVAIKEDNSVWNWGNNTDYNRSHPVSEQQFTPVLTNVQNN